MIFAPSIVSRREVKQEIQSHPKHDIIILQLSKAHSCHRPLSRVFPISVFCSSAARKIKELIKKADLTLGHDETGKPWSTTFHIYMVCGLHPLRFPLILHSILQKQMQLSEEVDAATSERESIWKLEDIWHTPLSIHFDFRSFCAFVNEMAKPAVDIAWSDLKSCMKHRRIFFSGFPLILSSIVQ